MSQPPPLLSVGASLPVSENLQFRLHSGSRMESSPASSPPVGPFSAPSSPLPLPLSPSMDPQSPAPSDPPSPPLAPLPSPLIAHHPRFDSLSTASTERGSYHPRFDSYSSVSDHRPIKPRFSISTSVPALPLHTLQKPEDNRRHRPSKSASGTEFGPKTPTRARAASRSTSGGEFSPKTRARANSAVQARHNKGAYMSYKMPAFLMNQSEGPLLTRLWTSLAYALILPPILAVCAVWWLIGHARIIAVIEFIGVIVAYFLSAYYAGSSFESGERDGSFSSNLGDLALLLAARSALVWASITMARYRSVKRAFFVCSVCLATAAFAAVKLERFGWDTPSSAAHWAGDNQLRARALFASAFAFSVAYVIGEFWVPTSLAKLEAVEHQLLSVRPGGFRSRAQLVTCPKSGLSYIFARKREPTDPASPSVSHPASEPSSAHSSPRDPSGPDGSPQPSPNLGPSAAPTLNDGMILEDDKPKPVFVLLPGFGAGKMVFLGEAEVLSEFADVYVLDLMGTGSSARPVFTSRTVQGAENFFVDAIETWRNSLGLGPMVLCGHSLGGYIAGCYALRYPQHVAHLVLASPVGIPEVDPSTPPHPLPFAWPIRTLIETIWTLHLAPQSVLRFLGPLGPFVMGKVLFWRFAETPMRDKEQVLNYMYHQNAGPASGERGLTRLLRFGLYARSALGPRLSELAPNLPLTFIYGANDVMDSSAGFRVTQVRHARKHARSDVWHVAAAGHQVFLEKHHVMSAALSALIRGHPIPLDPYPGPSSPHSPVAPIAITTEQVPVPDAAAQV